MRVDAHHHFWRYTVDDYGWIDDSMDRLRCDFLPSDLQQEIAAVGVDRVISVQARQSLEETEWLLMLSETSDFICGVVGWVALSDPDVESQLERFTQSSKLRAVRHVVQDEVDDEFVLREDFNRGVSLLKGFGLAYDLLIFERHLPATIEFVDRHPEQVFVLDHIAKPKISSNELEPWRTNIKQLAERPQVYCKVSGMVTEADPSNWTTEQLQPYWETVLEAFGPKRLMFGSDWPVCLLGSSYQHWYQTVQSLASQLTTSEQANLFGQTAAAAYEI